MKNKKKKFREPKLKDFEEFNTKVVEVTKDQLLHYYALQKFIRHQKKVIKTMSEVIMYMGVDDEEMNV